MERISIIVPVYNTELYLERCLNSLVNQTYRDIEIILIDDGSTDSSGDICDIFSEKDDRVIVIHNSNRGCVRSRKDGIRLATGRYVLFCDSDDYMEENSVEEMYHIAQHTNTDIVVCGYYTDEKGKRRENINCLPEGLYGQDNMEFLYKNMIFDFTKHKPGVLQSMCGKLFKKDLLTEVLMQEDERITLGEDAANVYLYLLSCKTIFLLNRCFYHYCIRENSMCTKKDIEIFRKIDIFNLYMQNKLSVFPPQYHLNQQLKAYILHFIEAAVRNNFGIDFSIPYIFENDLLGQISGKEIIIYGAGKVGKSFQEEISKHDDIKQVGWVDKNCKGEMMNRCRIISIDECTSLEFDYIIIAVLHENLYKEIKDELRDRIAENKIVWAKPSENPWLRKIEL